MFPLCIGKVNFDFRGCLSGKMSGQSGKKSINWHTGWLGEKDTNGDWPAEAWGRIQVFLPHISALLLSNFVATDVYALSLKISKSLPAVFFPFLV